MPTVVQFRRGTTAQNNNFLGANGEISVDTTLNVLRVADAVTLGGFAMVGQDCVQTIANKTYTGTLLSVTGNVTGSYIFGNGSQLSGIDATSIQSGTSNVKVTTSGGNIAVSVGGTSNVVVWATSGEYVTGIVSASGNITGGNINTGGNVSVTGNINLADTQSVRIGSLIISDDTIRSSEHNITIGSLGNIGNVIIGGNLTVNGNTTTFNSNVISTNDLTYNLANNASSSAQANGGGIEVGPVGSAFISWTYNNTANSFVSSGSITTSGNIYNNGANGTGNIGGTSSYFNTAFVKATSAQYADLAEMYTADTGYTPGTVVEFGGTHEITVTTATHSTQVAGIISTQPAYLMNSTQTGEHPLEVALVGRVPCLVVGTVRKGDRLVSSDLPGVAQALDINLYQPGCIVGKALEEYNSTEPGVIEVAVGRS